VFPNVTEYAGPDDQNEKLSISSINILIFRVLYDKERSTSSDRRDLRAMDAGDAQTSWVTSRAAERMQLVLFHPCISAHVCYSAYHPNTA
jgi:hypothetical protein